MSPEITLRQILNLDPALPAADDDVLAISQVTTATKALPVAQQVRVTNKITWVDLMKRVNENVSASRQTLVDSYNAVDAKLAGQIQALETLTTQLASRKQFISFPDVVIPANQLTSVLATEKVFTVTVSDLRSTDDLIVTPKSLPSGYGLRSYSWTATSLTLRVQCPILSVGGSPITFGLSAFR